MKANYQHLSKPEDGTVGKIYSYTMTVDIKNALTEGFFNTMWNNFMAGDDIIVRQIVENKLLQRQSLAVTFVSPVNVVVEPISDPITFTHGELEIIEKPDPESRTQHATGDWTYKHNGRGTYKVIDQNNDTVCIVSDKETAIAVARGDTPVPV